MTNRLDISVLIPTYNRADTLRETLEAMCLVDRAGLSVEYVVIDNNSTDDTRAVCTKFQGALPIRYLFEERQGKTCALNKALNELSLGDTVVLTDDDVTPCCAWLQAVWACTRRWPEHSVFGGPLRGIWPCASRPLWMQYAPLGYGDHFPLDSEGPYPPGPSGRPAGANYWIRRRVFDAGKRYDERMGPRPNNQVGGDDMWMLYSLKTAGYEIIYCPEALIEHRIYNDLAAGRVARHLAYTRGRTGAHAKEFFPPVALQQHRYLWYSARGLMLVWAAMRLAAAMCSISRERRLGLSLRPICDIGYNVECVQMLLQKHANAN